MKIAGEESGFEFEPERLENQTVCMPDKPLLIYDGECAFCRRQIRACQEVTGARVGYETLQAARARFPQIPPAEFSRAVQWVGSDGAVCSGAKAIFSALATATWYGRAGLFFYQKVPVFAHLTEWLYARVATRRK